MIPERLKRDRNWGPLLHLFTHNYKLNGLLTSQHIDLSSEIVKGAALKKLSAPWSQSEKFMLNLALHCYNERFKVDLADMDYLDPYNTKLAFEALQMRYGKGGSHDSV